MPPRAVKPISRGGKVSTPKKRKNGVLVRRLTQGALLAVTLAAARLDIEEMSEKKRLFDPGLLDRLRAPLTRYHE